MKVGGFVIALIMGFAPASFAQMRGPGGGGSGPPQPTRSSPTQNRPVGPRPGAADDEDARPQVIQRTEPNLAPPANPLEVSPEVQSRIGTDWYGGYPAPVGELHRSFYGYYQESRDHDYRFRFLPPLYLEHTRYPDTPNADRESLFGLLYYQRRSPQIDADVVFPAFWRIRRQDRSLLVLGPIAHRDAPGEHDNWFAPLYFEGSRKDGGYLHIPALLFTSHYGPQSAFTLAGPYFRSRSGSSVDWGLFPFVFHGDSGEGDDARRTYTLIPPALYFHRSRALDDSSLTVVGPVIAQSTPKRAIFDVAPLFFHIQGKPETGGIEESHTTVLPFFHYGKTPDESLFVTPLYLRRVTPTVDTLVTPFFTHATTRSRSTSLTMVGPILPIYYRSDDVDENAHALGIFPFFFHANSPSSKTLLTPLYGHFEDVGVSRTDWIFPSIMYSRGATGWETDVHPIVYTGRSGDASHTVLAPVFWDFANPRNRTTVGFPLYWRFADQTDDSITQIAANTVYVQRRVAGGIDWQFHVAPFFSYGESPRGYFWNVLFGFLGYSRRAEGSEMRALWIPITLSHDAHTAPANAAMLDATHSRE